MRKLSTLVGLTLLALTSTARAEETSAATAKTAPAAEHAAPEAAKAAPAEAATAKAAPPEASTAKAAVPASAAESAQAAPAEANVAAEPAATEQGNEPRKLQVGLSFLPMALGEYTYVKTTDPEAEDAYFAYGLGVSAAYEVLPGLLVGLAPQLTFNVRPKTAPDGGKQLDVMARIAYSYRLPDGISVFAEVLPGYSMIMLKRGSAPKGMVVAFGAGLTMDLTDRYFVSVGAGYQIGFQNQSSAVTSENRSRYVRVALGGGMRF
jgi:hypothetical protein